jgi:predicted ATP-dependent endonuclease of OLD family
MEKLIIKNFGPIKEAEIELKKVNVFIGPQGSGKSTIAKVISALHRFKTWSDQDWFATDLVTIIAQDFHLMKFFEPTTELSITTSNGRKIDINRDSVKFNNSSRGISQYSDAIYIPTERILVPLIAESSFLFLRNKTPIPKYISDFGILFQKARSENSSQKFNFLDDLVYLFEDNIDKIILKDGKILTLGESSSGIQTILPLLLVVDFLSSAEKGVDNNLAVSIEEPELSLFPSTQNDLLKFIFEKILLFNYSLTITTHSPYTLTAINNLIYAYQVGKENVRVQDIVPKNLWLNPDDVSAWFVQDGTVRSIIDNESKQIKAEEIDGISETLNVEYDKIMDLKLEKRS